MAKAGSYTARGDYKGECSRCVGYESSMLLYTQLPRLALRLNCSILLFDLVERRAIRVFESTPRNFELLLAVRLGLDRVESARLELGPLELDLCPVWYLVLPCVPVFLKNNRGPELSWSRLR